MKLSNNALEILEVLQKAGGTMTSRALQREVKFTGHEFKPFFDNFTTELLDKKLIRLDLNTGISPWPGTTITLVEGALK